jgi:hypothetical protein
MPPTATSINRYYKLKVEGTYGVENNVNHLDAAYQSPSSTQEIGSAGNTPVFITSSTDKWKLNINNNFVTPPTPNNNPDYRNDHIYEYYLGTGDGTNKYYYSYSDPNSITDNSITGKLTFITILE